MNVFFCVLWGPQVTGKYFNQISLTKYQKILIFKKTRLTENRSTNERNFFGFKEQEITFLRKCVTKHFRHYLASYKLHSKLDFTCHVYLGCSNWKKFLSLSSDNNFKCLSILSCSFPKNQKNKIKKLKLKILAWNICLFWKLIYVFVYKL